MNGLKVHHRYLQSIITSSVESHIIVMTIDQLANRKSRNSLLITRNISNVSFASVMLVSLLVLGIDIEILLVLYNKINVQICLNYDRAFSMCIIRPIVHYIHKDDRDLIFVRRAFLVDFL